MQQELVLAMLAREPSSDYELRARLRDALGPLGEAMNPGHVYVTLTRLEKAGLAVPERSTGSEDRAEVAVLGEHALVAAVLVGVPGSAEGLGEPGGDLLRMVGVRARSIGTRIESGSDKMAS